MESQPQSAMDLFGPEPGAGAQRQEYRLESARIVLTYAQKMPTGTRRDVLSTEGADIFSGKLSHKIHFLSDAPQESSESVPLPSRKERR